MMDEKKKKEKFVKKNQLILRILSFKYFKSFINL